MNWEQVALQVPGMAVLGVLVWLFLKHMQKSGSEFRDSLKQHSELTANCVDKMVHTHDRTVDSLDRNTEMFGRVETRLDQLSEIERLRLAKEMEPNQKDNRE